MSRSSSVEIPMVSTVERFCWCLHQHALSIFDISFIFSHNHVSRLLGLWILFKNNWCWTYPLRCASGTFRRNSNGSRIWSLICSFGDILPEYFGNSTTWLLCWIAPSKVRDSMDVSAALAEVGPEAKSYLRLAISPKSSIAISTSSAGYPKS